MGTAKHRLTRRLRHHLDTTLWAYGVIAAALLVAALIGLLA